MAEPALKIESDQDGELSNDNAGDSGGRQVNIKPGQTSDLGEIKPGQELTIGIDATVETASDNVGPPKSNQKKKSTAPTQTAPEMNNKPEQEEPKPTPKPNEPQQDYNKKLEPWDKDQQQLGVPTEDEISQGAQQDYTPPTATSDQQSGIQEEMDENRQLTDEERETRAEQEQMQQEASERKKPIKGRKKRKVDKLQNEVQEIIKELRGLQRKKKPAEAKKTLYEKMIAGLDVAILFLVILEFIAILVAILSWGYLSSAASWIWRILQRVLKKRAKAVKEVKRAKEAIKPIAKEMKKPLKKKRRLHKKINNIYENAGRDVPGKEQKNAAKKFK